MIILSFIGAIMVLIGSIWFIIAAFSESVLWGIGCIIVPFVSLFFLFSHWDKAGKPFLIQLGGFALVIVGTIAGGGFATQ